MIDKSKYELLPDGSYKSMAYADPSQLYMGDYWSHERNHSTIEEQKANVKEKNRMVIGNVIDGPVLEIACAPGTLLGDLKRLGHDCIGIEVDPQYKYDILKNAMCSVHFGMFPEITEDWIGEFFGNVVALDVIEHVEDGIAFLMECNRLLKPSGRLIIQAPIILEDGLMDEKMFNYSEHIWIYSIGRFTEMLNECGFELLSVGRWKSGHEQVVALKK